MRQRKFLELYAERRRREEEDSRRAHSPVSRRPFDRSAFDHWYDESIGRYHQVEKARKELQRVEALRRKRQEFTHCSFVSQAERGSGGLSRSGSSSSMGASVGAWQRKQYVRPGGGGGARAASAAVAATRRRHEEASHMVALVEDLKQQQALQLADLHSLLAQEKERRETVGMESARRLELGLGESRKKLKHFAETAEGKAFLQERAERYCQLNRGMSEEEALLEAENDLAKASESKLRSKIDSALHEQFLHDMQRIQLERLKVAWELIQLQRRCEGLLTAGTVTQAALQGYDMDLVDRVTNEAWYLEAREAAARKAGSEHSPPPRSGSLPPQRVRRAGR